MVVEKTYKYLLELSDDISKCKETSPAFGVFNRDKIEAFYEVNDAALLLASKNIEALLDEHVSKTPDGIHETYEVNGKRSWTFLSLFDKHEYHRKYGDFINQPVTVYL